MPDIVAYTIAATYLNLLSSSFAAVRRRSSLSVLSKARSYLVRKAFPFFSKDDTSSRERYSPPVVTTTRTWSRQLETGRD